MSLLRVTLLIASILPTLPLNAAELDTKELGRLLRAETLCCGRVSKIESWIQAGADVDTQADHGETALFYASLLGRTKAALHLLRRGANPNIAEDLDRVPLHKAAGDCNTKLVKALLDAGADVNFADHYGRTALMNATISKCDRTVALLLAQRQIKTDAVDDSLLTALDYADHPWIVEMLEKTKNVLNASQYTSPTSVLP